MRDGTLIAPPGSDAGVHTFDQSVAAAAAPRHPLDS